MGACLSSAANDGSVHPAAATPPVGRARVIQVRSSAQGNEGTLRSATTVVPPPTPEAVRIFETLEPTASVEMLHRSASQLRKAKAGLHPQDVRQFPENCAILASFVQTVAHTEGCADDARLVRAYLACMRAQTVDKDDPLAVGAAFDSVVDAFYATL